VLTPSAEVENDEWPGRRPGNIAQDIDGREEHGVKTQLGISYLLGSAGKRGFIPNWLVFLPLG
jgi:hypothetical protein